MSRIHGMASDHFQTMPWAPDETDWHFLVQLNTQRQLRTTVERYAHAYYHPGLYPPVPFEWLHMTIARIGSVKDISNDEMGRVVDLLRPTLSKTELPEFRLGPWWLWTGSVVLHITPEEPVTRLFNEVMSALETVLRERAPKLPPLIPHVTLAYARTYHQELEVYKQLSAQWIEPIPFHITALSLVKERQTVPFYSWEVVADISLGKGEQTKVA
jgi:2'-5' RNA ligase